MHRKFVIAALAPCGCALALAAPAFAQTTPEGMPFGAFRLFPSVDIAANYDDNVYRTQSLTQSDWYFGEQANVAIKSNWVRHALNVFGNVAAYQYSKRNSENHTDWTFGGDGLLDISSGLSATASGSYGSLSESRTSPDQSGYAKSPTQYKMGLANAALSYHPYHFSFTVGGNYVRYDYSPTKLIGFPDLNNRDRDHAEYTGYVKGGYEFSPGYAMFVQANYRQVQYDLALDRNGLDRTNHGYSINTGLDMLVTDLIKGQLFVGYMDERYKGALPDVKGFNYGANVDWTPTPFWAFHLTASRTPDATTIANASAADDQTVRLGVEYFITPDITALGHVGYTDINFRGSTRHDNTTEAGVGLNYAMNRLVSVKAEYRYQQRDSSIGGQNYTDNLIYVGLNLHI